MEKKNESSIATVAMADSFRTAELGADIPERALRQLDGKYHRPIHSESPPFVTHFCVFVTIRPNSWIYRHFKRLCLINADNVMLAEVTAPADRSSKACRRRSRTDLISVIVRLPLIAKIP